MASLPVLGPPDPLRWHTVEEGRSPLIEKRGQVRDGQRQLRRAAELTWPFVGLRRANSRIDRRTSTRPLLFSGRRQGAARRARRTVAANSRTASPLPRTAYALRAARQPRERLPVACRNSGAEKTTTLTVGRRQTAPMGRMRPPPTPVVKQRARA